MNQAAFMVLLLIAAMVVVGGSLMLLGPEDGSPDPPVIAFDEEHEADEVVVESVSPGLSWAEIQVQISVPGGFKVDEGRLVRTHGMVFTPVDVEEEVGEGDALRVCVEEPGEEEDGVEITLRHSPSGEIMGSWALLSVDACSELEEEERPQEDAGEGSEEGAQPGDEERAGGTTEEGMEEGTEEGVAGEGEGAGEGTEDPEGEGIEEDPEGGTQGDAGEGST